MQAESNLLLVLINSTSDYYYAYNPPFLPIPSPSPLVPVRTSSATAMANQSKRVGDAIEGPTSKRVSTTIIGTGEQGYAIVHVSYT